MFVKILLLVKSMLQLIKPQNTLSIVSDNQTPVRGPICIDCLKDLSNNCLTGNKGPSKCKCMILLLFTKTVLCFRNYKCDATTHQSSQPKLEAIPVNNTNLVSQTYHTKYEVI